MRIDEMPEHRAKLPHSSHDLSHPFGFTATVAHLLPVFHTLVDAGDSVNLKFDFKLRTQPLQAAAMETLETHVEYFFVPMFLLYQPFGSVYYQIDDEYSSMFQKSHLQNTQNFPVWDWEHVRDYLVENRKIRVSQNGVSMTETFGQSAYRLLEHLHFAVKASGFDSTYSSQWWNPNIFPYQLLAYHCIYQYYYRLDNRRTFNPLSFNWDRYYNQVAAPIALDGDTTELLLRLHYRPMDSDYFTDSKVSPIVDVLNLNAKTLLPVVNDWLSRSSVPSLIPNISSGSIGTDQASPQQLSNPSESIQTNFGFPASTSVSANLKVGGSADVNTANIRALFANEKLWSITGRAKKHYDDQTLAHFGFKVPHDPKHEITCFGHDRGFIQIGEVISTAQTAEGSLGTIAGKGYGRQDNKPHYFKAPCHGVVMAIFSVTPHVRYAGTLGKENSVTSRLDLPIPEYDHLGLQPLFRYEAMPEAIASERNDVMGWQYRYEQWKRRYPRLTSAFAEGNPLSTWMTSSFPWVSQMVNTANRNSYLDYVYKPWMLNQLFTAQYQNTWQDAWDSNATLMYDADPFVIDGFVSCSLNSWMSDYSLPRLDA